MSGAMGKRVRRLERHDEAVDGDWFFLSLRAANADEAAKRKLSTAAKRKVPSYLRYCGDLAAWFGPAPADEADPQDGIGCA
jgi:hypothetical protein